MISLLVSSTEEEARRLTENGPRRDFIEIANAVDARICYRRGGPGAGSRKGRFVGGHVVQAWEAARDSQPGHVLFADGEHIGLPLAAFLAMRGKRRRVRVVMLGHLVTRRWKTALFWVASRAFPSGEVLVHSVRQKQALARWLARSWQLEAIPYQVDTCYWREQCAKSEGRPLIVAAGSENRDYVTLTRAVAGLDADVVIAAGSHWARATAAVETQPPNVEYLSQPLSFDELRQLYRRATVVVVPLTDVPNQSGVTCILEAMSMGTPVVVSATAGQRECVSGPLIGEDGLPVGSATADRGPWVLEQQRPAGDLAENGLYVPVGNPRALRAALDLLLGSPELRERHARAGRAYAERYFSIERYTARVAKKLLEAATV